ncbi:inositol 1,4,5-trisphosphate receptor-interacting protein [Chanos chanos]|uniref:Inositol 1,4,5-trisphosphate receptor-interacting protein n=1 Tax=Chanos chanos TaxID=29144 RepID=A0A6J2V799_CHACN|nr:inositol 1,4,5-trisphosphate receptor-interacting protein [Chanos chanos]
MQGTIMRVCMVVAATILNHPLLFPKENTTSPEEEEDLLARMREHEERMQVQQAQLEQELSQVDQDVLDTDPSGFSWYFWSALSLVIFFTIEVFRQDLILSEDSDMTAEDEEGLTYGPVNAEILPLDKGTLNSFCETSFHAVSHESCRVREFVEGFVDDLLEALRSICDPEMDVEVEDFVGVGSMFESWRVCRPLMCDIIVPFAPPQPYGFQFQLWCSDSSDFPLDLQGCGRINLIQLNESCSECLCGSSNLNEDMLCLLHNRNSHRTPASRDLEELLCLRNTPHLSKDQVMKWFQISVTKAWGQISHKYDFELTFRNLDSPGALKVRFRSGKVVVLNVTPAVQLDNTDAYFISHFPADSANSSDTHWHLSFTVCERNLLKLFAKSLPENSCHLRCLQILSFLHKKQTALSGSNALCNYHLKTALMHLLLSKRSSAWRPQNLDQRLRDLLSFLQKSLQEKKLCHIIIGNRLIPKQIRIPEAIRTAEPVNLFRSLVLQRQLYSRTVEHFQEMLKNAPVLIREYTSHLPNGSLSRGLHAAVES